MNKALWIISFCIFLMSENRDFASTIGIMFSKIPSGSFMMGTKPPKCTKDDPSTILNEYLKCTNSINDDESPYHKVKIKSFYLATAEITQFQYYKLMGKNPSHFKSAGINGSFKYHPVEKVSWNDAQEFIKKINKKENTTRYRLPTEEEWEYAARAGTSTKWSLGNAEYNIVKYAWYKKNAYKMGKGRAGYGTHKVKRKRPNKFGLYDMHGNVWEWTGSCYTLTYDGKCYRDKKVYRGGGWNSKSEDIRSAVRFGDYPDEKGSSIGFRIARD